ncbi:MAG: ABC transporter permease [Chloroflexi bacterium]|nr:MAG: ABC transporter permease [Chloroflexota bacterium]
MKRMVATKYRDTGRPSKARTLLEVWFANMSAYRAEIVIWMLTGSIPLIMLAVWIGKAQAAGGAVGDFTPQRFAAYFLAAWVSQQLVVAWVAWELDLQIRQGILSAKLLRPLDPLWEHLAMHVTERLVRVPLAIIVIVVGLFIVPGTQLTPDLPHALLYLLSINLAFLIRFLIAYCVGILAFWFEQAIAVEELYYSIAMFLTGSFAPLDLYPVWARTIIEWLPFPYVIYYPVQILTGEANGLEIVRIIAVQLAWITIFGVLRSLLWRRGLRRYGAVGA